MRLCLVLSLALGLASSAAHAGRPATTNGAKRTAAKRAVAAPTRQTKGAARKVKLQPTQSPVVSLTEAQRGELAVKAVRSSIAPWLNKGTTVTIRPAIVAFNGDPRNPITGSGPVRVFVTQAPSESQSRWRRVLARFNPFGKQQYLVHIGTSGEATVLERISMAPQRRLGRFLASKLPLLHLATDFLRSDKLSEGLWTFAGASGAAALSPALSGAMFMRVAQVFAQGIKSQNEVRARALAGTVSWAHAAHISDGRWPTLMETYRAYEGKIAEQQEGTRPLSLGDFAEALSVRQL